MQKDSFFKLAAAFSGALLLVGFLALPALAQDADCDGVPDVTDNCPSKFNPAQGDIDQDGLGNRCDPDKDGDLIANDTDNCRRVANADQLDGDGDGVGDACDECDEDPQGAVINGHGCTVDQLCPCDGPEPDVAWKNHGKYVKCVKKKAIKKFVRKKRMTRDEARQLIQAAKDSMCGHPQPTDGDNDGDGILDDDDNCRDVSNPSQKDTDGDGIGNACDSDKDNDGVLNPDDNCPVDANAGGQADDADADGAGDACDLCPDTPADAITNRHGCAIRQLCPCEVDADGKPWKNHGKYVKCVVDHVRSFRRHKLIDSAQGRIVRDAAKASECGEREKPCD